MRGMSKPKRFNFRLTSGYVTDGTDEIFVNALTAYPTTTTVDGESVTYGFESGSINSLDRTTSSPYAPELAGINYIAPGTATFRIDLPVAGNYNLVFAGGDEGGSFNTYANFADGSTVLTTVGSSSGTVPQGSYVDAGGITDTAAAWQATSPNGGTLYAATFATTICRLNLLSVSVVNVWAHFGVIPAGDVTVNATLAWIT